MWIHVKDADGRANSSECWIDSSSPTTLSLTPSTNQPPSKIQIKWSSSVKVNKNNWIGNVSAAFPTREALRWMMTQSSDSYLQQILCSFPTYPLLWPKWKKTVLTGKAFHVASDGLMEGNYEPDIWETWMNSNVLKVRLNFVQTYRQCCFLHGLINRGKRFLILSKCTNFHGWNENKKAEWVCSLALITHRPVFSHWPCLMKFSSFPQWPQLLYYPSLWRSQAYNVSLTLFLPLAAGAKFSHDGT